MADRNNDRPSETPKPPEGYENWLDWLLNDHRNGYSTPVMVANRELSAIRAKAAAYDEAMKACELAYPIVAAMCNTLAETCSESDADALGALQDTLTKSGRFKP